MLLTSNNKSKKGGKTTEPISIESNSGKTGQRVSCGPLLIDPKHEKLISFNTTATSVAPVPGLMFKKHCCKKSGNGNGSSSEITTAASRPTPTWLINPATPPLSPQCSKEKTSKESLSSPAKVKVSQGKSFSESFIPRRKLQQQKKDSHPSHKKQQDAQKQKPRSFSTSLRTLTNKMDHSRIQITISRDDGKQKKAKPRDEDNGTNLDLTKIMCNFISAAETPSNLSPETRRASNATATMIQEDDSQNKGKSDTSPMTVVENSGNACLDFGAPDFLCDFNTKRGDEDEIEVDISSDTDSCNFIAATPPNRFSDSDFDAIEPISITLETSLNPQQPGKVIIHKIEGPVQPGRRPETGVNVTLLPRRPFRRHISLPPSIFMSRFFGHATTATATTTGSNDSSPLISPKNEMTFILKSSSSGFIRAAAAAAAGTTSFSGGPFHYPRINRFESISSADVAEELLHEYCTGKSNSSWSMSIDTPSSGGSDLELTDPECAFTSEIEKRALIVRSMRRLVRQDTTVGNFAPAHFCNT